MSITAIIDQGMIKLPSDVAWASGTVVRIEPVEEQTPTLCETLKDFDGMAGDLPADLAANLSGTARTLSGVASKPALRDLAPALALCVLCVLCG
jgi:hypothetical protein